MEELIKMVTSKVGISELQAKSAIETVVSFLKNKLPAGLGSQVESFIHGKGDSTGSTEDDIKNKTGGFLG